MYGLGGKRYKHWNHITGPPRALSASISSGDCGSNFLFINGNRSLPPGNFHRMWSKKEAKAEERGPLEEDRQGEKTDHTAGLDNLAQPSSRTTTIVGNLFFTKTVCSKLPERKQVNKELYSKI